MYPKIAVHGQYRRLIPSKYPTIDIYERFGSPEMRAFAAELEKVTNPRLAAKSRLTGGDTAADSGSPRLQNWNHAPFAYPMPEGTYMLPEPYPVMELAGDERGALARAIVRREEFLARTEEPACEIELRNPAEDEHEVVVVLVIRVKDQIEAAIAGATHLNVTADVGRHLSRPSGPRCPVEPKRSSNRELRRG